MKKIHLASQFPSIYRRITEKLAFKKVPRIKFSLPLQSKLDKIPLSLKISIALAVIIVLVIGIGIFGLRTYQDYAKTQQILAQRQQIQSKINFWQSIADKYEGYKDAYFQMAILDYQLGNWQKAKLENKKALSLDPNFEDAKKLEEILDKK
jgi:tetratricopeptide (TPR) repeat protein